MYLFRNVNGCELFLKLIQTSNNDDHDIISRTYLYYNIETFVKDSSRKFMLQEKINYKFLDAHMNLVKEELIAVSMQEE